MAKVHRTVKVGTGTRRVVPVLWEEGVPFALKLEARWRQAVPAVPERVRYLELELGIPDPREPDEDGRCRYGDSDCQILPGGFGEREEDDLEQQSPV